MSHQYIYNQPIYGKNDQYQIGNNVEYGEYEAINSQQGSNKNVITREPISYEAYEQLQQQPQYYGQNQGYSEQVYYQNPHQETQVIPGYENYYQVQQKTHQQMIPKPQTIAQQQAKLAQQKAKMVRQMVQQNKNIPQNQYIQPPFPSRNPNKRQQYQQPQLIQKKYSGQMNQQQPFIQKKYSGQMRQQQQPLIQKKYSGQMNKQEAYQTYAPEQFNQEQIQYEQPQIEPDFQPEIPVANSVLNQSQIPFQQKQDDQIKITPAYNPQAQTNPSYVLPQRNPNLNVKQYNYSNDPRYVTVVNPNIQKRVSGEKFSQKSSGKIKNSLDDENIEQPEIGIGSTNFEQNNGMNENQKLEQIETNNTEIKDMKTVEPLMESKMNEEIAKENPIEEKFPDQSNVDNLNNNDDFPQEMNQNQSQIGDIDDNLDHLPTVNSIMKGVGELLPPPTKKKYK